MTTKLSFFIAIIICINSYSQDYPIVDTGVTDFYSNTAIITEPNESDAFYGQDASYIGNQPSYTDNGDGTVTDNVTGLMWQQDMGNKMSYDEALIAVQSINLGGYSDWRIPTIKELYSLANFTGRCFGDNAGDLFIDTNYFDQPIGDTSAGEREIDAQTWSKTFCIDLLFGKDESIYGYNFVDGRLKGYPRYDPGTGSENTMYFRMVRGNTNYGINNFVDNNDGTITDLATGLMWQQTDDGNTYDWENALSYSENLTLADHTDWRLPNPKELQSIVDYSRSPSTTASPGIDPLFSCTEITDPDGNSDQYGYYWTGSPLQDGPEPYSDAVYICFGDAQGQMETPPNSGITQLLNVHGVGAQRNDPKTGNTNDYPDYFGPQGDVQYVYNLVRCVRNVDHSLSTKDFGYNDTIKVYPNPTSSTINIKSTKPIQKVELINIQGQIINSIQNVNTLKTINVNNLNSGIYVLRVYDKNKVFTKKITIK